MQYPLRNALTFNQSGFEKRSDSSAFEEIQISDVINTFFSQSATRHSIFVVPYNTK